MFHFFFFFLYAKVIVSVWARAQTKKTPVVFMWTLPRPGTTSTSGSVASECWPERRGTGARWRRIACGRPPLLPSSTTLSMSAASWETRSKVGRHGKLRHVQFMCCMHDVMARAEVEEEKKQRTLMAWEKSGLLNRPKGVWEYSTDPNSCIVKEQT